MTKKLIARISEGLGNQLFMYANSYSMAKSLGYELFIDNFSAYRKLKIRSYLLDEFKISGKVAEKDDMITNLKQYVKYKILKKIDFIKKDKSFLIEQKNNNKESYFKDYLNMNFSKKVFVEGHYESEKYFNKYKSDITKEFRIKNINQNELFINPDEIKNSNSVSIALRFNRFDEKDNSNQIKKNQSDIFVKSTLEYIKKGIFFCKTKLDNPKFYIFSNQTKNLDHFFDDKNIKTINHNNNKIINDFYLSSLCKHFIVGPTTFHWWSAYLGTETNKICIRPPDDLKFSSNKDIYPDTWIKIIE